jgi:hypothetical protein
MSSETHWRTHIFQRSWSTTNITNQWCFGRAKQNRRCSIPGLPGLTNPKYQSKAPVDHWLANPPMWSMISGISMKVASFPMRKKTSWRDCDPWNLDENHEIFEVSSSPTRLGLASPGPSDRRRVLECFQCIWVADKLKVVPRNWLIS